MTFKYQLRLFSQCGPCEILILGGVDTLILQKSLWVKGDHLLRIEKRCVVVMGVVLLCLIRENSVGLG